jgi:hypothetical protein
VHLVGSMLCSFCHNAGYKQSKKTHILNSVYTIVINCTPGCDYKKKDKENPSITKKGFSLLQYRRFSTCVNPKGPPSGNTYIQITKRKYWDVLLKYKCDLICEIHRFILKGNLTVYSCSSFL